MTNRDSLNATLFAGAVSVIFAFSLCIPAAVQAQVEIAKVEVREYGTLLCTFTANGQNCTVPSSALPLTQGEVTWVITAESSLGETKNYYLVTPDSDEYSHTTTASYWTFYPYVDNYHGQYFSRASDSGSWWINGLGFPEIDCNLISSQSKSVLKWSSLDTALGRLHVEAKALDGSTLLLSEGEMLSPEYGSLEIPQDVLLNSESVRLVYVDPHGEEAVTWEQQLKN